MRQAGNGSRWLHLNERKHASSNQGTAVGATAMPKSVPGCRQFSNQGALLDQKQQAVVAAQTSPEVKK